MTIHKEGYKILFVSLIILAALNFALSYFYVIPDVWLDVLLFSSVVFYILILQFFRNPKISVDQKPSHIIAPADGKVVVIESTRETEYLNEERTQISIFMSPLNVHVNRNPVSGILKYFKYHPGKYLVAWHPKASTENERTTLVYQLDSGLQILIRQIAGAVARRIRWYVKEGEVLNQGAEFGFIKFGSRVDIFVPLDTEILVKEGDKTTAGKTILARLN